MNKIYKPEKENWKDLLKRPAQSMEEIESLVTIVFKEVGAGGDHALKKFTQRFDNVLLNAIAVSKEDIDSAKKQISPVLKDAILMAKNNIEKFHKAQQTSRIEVETSKGVLCWQEK
ncbi:MAG: histidinol dehydrogenase, partial [Maribacter sp.]|nr:histidinol dehydrogenase [Maribacter sp.]